MRVGRERRRAPRPGEQAAEYQRHRTSLFRLPSCQYEGQGGGDKQENERGNRCIWFCALPQSRFASAAYVPAVRGGDARHAISQVAEATQPTLLCPCRARRARATNQRRSRAANVRPTAEEPQPLRRKGRERRRVDVRLVAVVLYGRLKSPEPSLPLRPRGKHHSSSWPRRQNRLVPAGGEGARCAAPCPRLPQAACAASQRGVVNPRQRPPTQSARTAAAGTGQ